MLSRLSTLTTNGFIDFPIIACAKPPISNYGLDVGLVVLSVNLVNLEIFYSRPPFNVPPSYGHY